MPVIFMTNAETQAIEDGGELDVQNTSSTVATDPRLVNGVGHTHSIMFVNGAEDSMAFPGTGTDEAMLEFAAYVPTYDTGATWSVRFWTHGAAANLVYTGIGNTITAAARGTTEVGWSVPCYSPGTWRTFHIHIKVNDTTGFIKVYRDSDFLNPLIDAGLIDTLDSNIGGSTIEAITINAGQRMHFTDIIITDPTDATGFSKGAFVHRINMAGDGADAGWTPSAGTRIAAISPVPATTTNNINATTSGLAQTFTPTALPAWVASIDGIMPKVKGSKDAATVGGVKFRIKTSATDVDGVSHGLSFSNAATYGEYRKTDGVGAAWTIAKINGSEYGLVSADV